MSGSTVAEHLTHNPKIKGLNHSGTGREKVVKKSIAVALLQPASTVAKHSTHNPRTEGSNPNGTRRKKIAKK